MGPKSKPRRRTLRGSDFLMRWSQGVWSEQRIVEAINASRRFWAVPFGPSGAAPDKPDEAAHYFERLTQAEAPGQKRPDLLVFGAAERERAGTLSRGLAAKVSCNLPATTHCGHWWTWPRQ